MATDPTVRFKDDLLSGSDGPLWFRGLAIGSEAEACAIIDELIRYNPSIKRVAVGHTIQESGFILPRCQGRLLLIDLGISRALYGKMGALEIEQDDVYALYPGRRVKLT
ncbi:hypothetical protein HDV00_010181 [Rhizophlyctis rosea]|nr:hypothetical protein HDV00_010181 [Rhizophlyctis rosea]